MAKYLNLAAFLLGIVISFIWQTDMSRIWCFYFAIFSLGAVISCGVIHDSLPKPMQLTTFNFAYIASTFLSFGLVVWCIFNLGFMVAGIGILISIFAGSLHALSFGRFYVVFGYTYFVVGTAASVMLIFAF